MRRDEPTFPWIVGSAVSGIRLAKRGGSPIALISGRNTDSSTPGTGQSIAFRSSGARRSSESRSGVSVEIGKVKAETKESTSVPSLSPIRSTPRPVRSWSASTCAASLVASVSSEA